VGKITVNKITSFQSADDDDVFIALRKMEQVRPSHKRKAPAAPTQQQPKKKVVFF
jgi:hypothetical protein